MIIIVHAINTLILISLSLFIFSLHRRISDLEQSSSQRTTSLRHLHEMIKILRANLNETNDKVDVFTEMTSEMMDLVKSDQPTPPSE